MKEEKAGVSKPLFRTHKSVSVDEIMAAGGPTIFGLKSGKNNQTLIEAMKKTSLGEEAFTDEEWENMLQQLRETK